MSEWSMQVQLLAALSWYLLINVLTFLAYAWDKRAARRHRTRVPERRLYLLELLGGFPMAWVAILTLRHKSRKPGFLVRTLCCSVLGFALLLMVFWLAVGTA